MKFSSTRYLMLITTIFFVITLSAFANNLPSQLNSTQKQLAALEVASGGQIGISAVDTANNRHIQYRAQERFPMDCTAKAMGVAAILKKSMTDNKLLQEKIYYTKKDLIEWSPITKKHIKNGMTVAQLCKAAITVSDNTAMNLLLKKIGGPQGVDDFLRLIGDNTFNLKTWWPNDATWQWGDVRDTSTPAAMQKSFQRLVLGNALASSQHEQFIAWLKDNKYGNARIRAGVPKGWIVADKTGTNFYDGAMGDIGVIWPPKCKPIVIAIYYKKDKKDAEKRQYIIASATTIILNAFARTDQCINHVLSKSSSVPT